jgi:mRNA-degrading endonuclease RelE of RelBE toxin-antitoxin system
MAFEIILSPEAIDHLSALPAHHRRILLDAIDTHLANEPTMITRRRKLLRPNPLASWELRVDQFRVYYQVESAHKGQFVYVIAVGKKIRNRVIIGGMEVEL